MPSDPIPAESLAGVEDRARPRRTARAALSSSLAWSLVGNLLLSLGKAVAGFLSGSHALVADSVHSLSDVVHTTVTMIGRSIARRPADSCHPYGHGNAEALAGLVVSTIILATGIGVIYDAIHLLLDGIYQRPHMGAWIVAGVVGVVKIGLAVLTVREARRENSPALRALAKDHRADALTAFSTMVGIFLASYGLPIFDPLMALVIGLVILWIIAPGLRENVDILMDATPRGDLVRRVEESARGEEAVFAVARIRVHPLGSSYRVELEIDVAGDLSVSSGHRIADRVRDRILEEEPFVEDVHVHVNPHRSEE